MGEGKEWKMGPGASVEERILVFAVMDTASSKRLLVDAFYPSLTYLLNQLEIDYTTLSGPPLSEAVHVLRQAAYLLRLDQPSATVGPKARRSAVSRLTIDHNICKFRHPALVT